MVWWQVLRARWRRRALWAVCGVYRGRRREVSAYLDRWEKRWYGSTTQGKDDPHADRNE